MYKLLYNKKKLVATKHITHLEPTKTSQCFIMFWV